MSKSDPSEQPLPKNVRVLSWASFFNDVGSEMIFPLMPQFLISFLGGNKSLLGIIEGTGETVASFLKLFSGGWSDRARGRKPFVFFGYALAALVRPLIGVVTAPWQLFAVRISDRTGKGIRTSPRDAMIADVTEPASRGRAFGLNRAMDHLGAAVGPVLATAFLLLWPGQLRPLFLLALVPGILAVGLLFFGLREGARREASQDRGRWQMARFDRRFRLYLLAVLVFNLGNSSDAFLLVRAGELGVALWLLPLLWCALHVMKSAASFAAGRVLNRFGPRAMIFCGWLAYAGIYVLFGLADSAWQAWPLFLAYGFFFAAVEPAEKTLVANLVGAEQRGLAYGWFHAAVGFAALPASLLFGVIYDNYQALAAFATGAALALVAAMLLAGVRPRPALSSSGGT
jgi:MFS family permease